MIATRLFSFLPSAIAVVAVGALSWALDLQSRQLQMGELRNTVIAETEIIRTRLETQIESGGHIAQGLAAVIRRDPNISQEEFSTVADAVSSNSNAVINLGWAPDLIITRVHPVAGNERALGLDYRNVPEQLGDVLRARDTGQTILVGPINLVQGGKGLILRVPVYSNTRGDVAFQGILSAVYSLDAYLSAAMPDAEENIIELMLAPRNAVPTPENAIYGDFSVAYDAPVTMHLRVADAAWTLYARPVGGWDTPMVKPDRNVGRGVMVFVALLILLPLFLANALAVSRQTKIREMRRADDRLTGLVQNAPGVFFTFSMNEQDHHKFEFLTDGAEELFGLRNKLLYNSSNAFWKAIEPGDAQVLREKISESRDTLMPWNSVIQFQTPKGQTKWLEGWGHPMRLDDNITRWDSFMVDVTAEFESAREIERQAEIARQAQKQESIGQLSGGVAHDFNNMLAVIRGNLEMLHEDLTAEKVEEDDRLDFVTSAITAAERGSDLTKKMLSFARRARLEPENLSINEIVKELDAWTARTLPATITTRFELESDLPKVHVDRSSTASALLNLIVNARDAMQGEGHLTIRTEQVKLTAEEMRNWPDKVESGSYVMLSVADTGSGIPKDVLENIFDPFFTTKGPGAGSGLGLSMVHGFVKQSGGAIRVLSTVGTGTTFQLFFKALAGEQPDETAVNGTASTQNGKPFKILVAEDEDAVRKVLTTALTRLGHTVESAPDGDSALAKFRTQPDFDLLLTDMVMPGHLQGPALAKAVRNIVPDLPVIFLSGYASVRAHEMTKEDAPGMRLMKPVTRTELSSAIQTLMQPTGDKKPGESNTA